MYQKAGTAHSSLHWHSHAPSLSTDPAQSALNLHTETSSILSSVTLTPSSHVHAPLTAQE